jgi:hypothetical protein
MTKRFISTAIAAAATVLMSLSQGAQAREFADIYTECGLGAMIAPNNSVVAAITNVTWDLGTTAISSNASSADTCNGGKKKTAALILESYPQVEADLARGQGQFVSALLSAAGCKAEVHAGLTSVVRAELARAVAAPAYASQTRYQQAEALHRVLHQRIDSEFSQACSAA